MRMVAVFKPRPVPSRPSESDPHCKRLLALKHGEEYSDGPPRIPSGIRGENLAQKNFWRTDLENGRGPGRDERLRARRGGCRRG